jgi:hypothetical protein
MIELSDGNSVLCSGVEGMKPTARLHKILAKDESNQIDGLRLPSGDFTASDHFPNIVSS